MYGADGAPANTVYEPVPPARRDRLPKDPNAKPDKASQRAKAKAKANAKAKAEAWPEAKAKGKAKSKAKAKSAAAKSAAATAHRRGRAALPQPADAQIPSCGKFRNSGCAACHQKAGLVLNADSMGIPGCSMTCCVSSEGRSGPARGQDGIGIPGRITCIRCEKNVRMFVGQLR